MAFDEYLFEKLRRLFLISNIIIVAIIGVSSTILAFLALIDSSTGINYFFIIGLALSIPGWTFLILYGWGCYDTKDWRRTVAAFLASLQIIVFLSLLIIYFIDYFF